MSRHEFLPLHSLDDVADIAVIYALRLLAGAAVDLVETSEQNGLPVGRVVKAVKRSRELLVAHRSGDERRHDDHEFALIAYVIAAGEQRAENGQVLEPGG